MSDTITAAELQSIRELCGYETADLAKMFDSNERTVRRWLDGTTKRIPEEVVEWALFTLADFRITAQGYQASSKEEASVPKGSGFVEIEVPGTSRPARFYRAAALVGAGASKRLQYTDPK